MNSSKQFAALFAGALFASVGAGAYWAGELGAAFGLFALLTIGGALICLFARSVVRSAFALLSTFLGTSGLFLLLGSDFLAMAQVLIYVGGILALLLFGVMLTPPDLSERRLPRVFAALLGAGAVGGLAVWRCADVAAFTRTGVAEAPRSDAEVIGVAFLDPTQYLVPFELAAVFLTVALVAAVYIARRRSIDPDTKAVP
jgi:NADH:ubiquinone oxidoreductase subunit 6 (subunit J)